MDPRVDEAVKAAVIELIERDGYRAVSMAKIAKQAGVSTASLYRRWDSKADLIRDAVTTWAGELAPQPDSGDLLEDLRLILADKIDAFSGRAGRLIVSLVGEATHDTELADLLEQTVLSATGEHIRVALRRATDRGEPLGRLTVPVVTAFLLGGPLTALFLAKDTPAAMRSMNITEVIGTLAALRGS